MLWEYLGHSKRPRHVAMKNPEAKDILVRSVCLREGLVLMALAISNTRHCSDNPRYRAPEPSSSNTKAKITT